MATKKITLNELKKLVKQVMEEEESGKMKLPEKNSPEWHQLQIAKKTIRMNPAMAAIMGGMTYDEAEEILKKYGIKH